MNSLPAILDELGRVEPCDLLAAGQPVIIYGAGGFGRDVARALRGQGRTVTGFLDRKVTNDVDGIPCRSPDADLSDWLRQDATVLLGMHNHRFDPLPVRNELLALGFRRVHLPVEYHHLVEKELGVRYWLGNRGVYRRHLEELKKLHALLEDDKSRELLLSTLAYRALAKPNDQPEAEPEASYFPGDLPRWGDPLNWVDGGACDGDSLLALPLDRYRCDNVYAFEPDPENFEKLQSAIAQFSQLSPSTQVSSWQCGLGREETVQTFKIGLGPGSVAAADGEMDCSIERLDSILAKRPVNLIKLDIEGAEPDALLGAENILREQKPGLAICIYHTPEHLWEIPLALAQRHPGYRFYLRCHGYSSFDLVLYAV